jgi:hypothetical protein
VTECPHSCELETIREEAIVDYFKVPSQGSNGVAKENHETPHQDSLCSGRDSSRASPECKSRALTFEPRFSATHSTEDEDFLKYAFGKKLRSHSY